MRLIVGILSLLLSFSAYAQDRSVEKVYVVFKTHLDVGFTDLSSIVTERYMKEFIPKALDVSEKLRVEGNENERYVWTTGSWLIWTYLQQAAPQEKARLQEAIKRGDIVWNGVPYTVESETMTEDLFSTCLLVSKQLDVRYGKETVAAKMTDVPGHTRGIVPLLAKAGIRLLHVGVNPASPLPAVPKFCRWRDPATNEEVILMYQQDYGMESLLPGGKIAVSVNFTGDNHGPHSYAQVKSIYAELRKKYPQAQLIPASFNEIAHELEAIKETLPVVTSEIGDTWIYGYGSSPIRMAKFRALSSLYTKWLKEGMKQDSDESLSFALQLGLIAEHTQGVDVKTHLRNWDKYDVDAFQAARSTSPFRKTEKSWEELDDYLEQAICCLSPSRQQEARAVLDAIDHLSVPTFTNQAETVAPGRPWNLSLLHGKLKLGGLFYQMYDSLDYESYLSQYLRARYGWALDDLGKTGLGRSKAVSLTIPAEILRQEMREEPIGTYRAYELRLPPSKADARVYPERLYVEVHTMPNQKQAEIAVTIWNKPAVRLPEAYWFSFLADNIEGIVAEKTGSRVDVMDVVEKGNRQMHGIDRYIDIVTSTDTIRIWSPTAFLANIGEAKGINYSLAYPDIRGGVHFNLSNNLWGTNFQMWNEGSLTYRFKVEVL